MPGTQPQPTLRRGASRDRRPTRAGLAGLAGLAAAAALTVALVPSLGAGAQQPTTTAAAAPGLPVDSVVIAQQDPAQVAVLEAGKPRTLADGLAKPNGVAALDDGSVLVADSGNNRVVGIGGRFGPTLKEIVKVEFPEGIGVGADGSVYVTLLQKGEVGRVDLQAGTYTKVAGDLKGPGGVAVRDGKLYVPEAAVGGQDVVEITPTGTKTVVASGFEQPIGIVAGPDKTFYVADYKANRIVKVDDTGQLSEFAKVDLPIMVTTTPAVLAPGAPFTMSVSAKDGIVRFDQTGKRTGTTTLKSVTGVASVPAPAPVIPTTTTSAPVPTSAAAPPGTQPAAATSVAPSTPRTTRVRTTTTTIVAAIDPESSSSSGLIVLVIVILAALAVAAVFLFRKPKNMGAAGFEERPLDTETVADAFGPCAAEEVELAEAEGGRDAISVQRESAEKRVAEAEARAQAARERAEAAGAQHAEIEAERAAARRAKAEGTWQPPAGSTEIKPDMLGLTTDAGREALASFATGALDAGQLEETWRELGEQQAIDVVRTVGERRARLDPEQVWPDERRAEQARVDALAEADDADLDATYAREEIERLNQREAEAEARIEAARTALDECQARHKADQAAKAAAARAAAPPPPDDATGEPGTEGQSPDDHGSGPAAADRVDPDDERATSGLAAAAATAAPVDRGPTTDESATDESAAVVLPTPTDADESPADGDATATEGEATPRDADATVDAGAADAGADPAASSDLADGSPAAADVISQEPDEPRLGRRRPTGDDSGLPSRTRPDITPVDATGADLATPERAEAAPDGTPASPDAAGATPAPAPTAAAAGDVDPIENMRDAALLAKLVAEKRAVDAARAREAAAAAAAEDVAAGDGTEPEPEPGDGRPATD